MFCIVDSDNTEVEDEDNTGESEGMVTVPHTIDTACVRYGWF